MEQKRSFPVKELAITLMLLFAGRELHNFFREINNMVSNLFQDDFFRYADVWVYIFRDTSYMITTLFAAMGFLLMGVALFGKKLHRLALLGAVLLILGVVADSLGYWLEVMVYLFRGGFDDFFDSVFSSWFLLSQSSLLLQLIIYAAIAFVLLLNKKAGKLLCFVPAVLMAVSPIWYWISNIIYYLTSPYPSDGWFVSSILNAGFVVHLLEAVGIAVMLLAVTKKEAPVQEPQVTEETPAAEEAACEEAACEVTAE